MSKKPAKTNQADAGFESDSAVASGGASGGDATRRPADPMKLFVIILDQPALLDDLLTGFLDLGVPGATVVESRGMGQIVRQDMPVFAGLADMFGESTGSRLIFSVLRASLVDSVFALVKELAEAAEQPKSMVCFTLAVDAFRGVRQ